MEFFFLLVADDANLRIRPAKQPRREEGEVFLPLHLCYAAGAKTVGSDAVGHATALVSSNPRSAWQALL